MRIEIPQAHGEAIAERMQIMRQVMAQFNLLRMEDKRHVDAVLKSLAHNPDDWEQYDLAIDRGHYYLDLKARESALTAAAVTEGTITAQPQSVNGAPQPSV